VKHSYKIGQKLKLIYKGQYLKASIISLGSQSDNRKDGYFYARLQNGERKLYNYDLNRVNWACNVIEYNETEKEIDKLLEKLEG